MYKQLISSLEHTLLSKTTSTKDLVNEMIRDLEIENLNFTIEKWTDRFTKESQFIDSLIE